MIAVSVDRELISATRLAEWGSTLCGASASARERVPVRVSPPHTGAGAEAARTPIGLDF